MPYFDHNPLEKLAVEAADAGAQLDLRGLPSGHAMRSVERLLAHATAGESFLIRFDPARGDGRETLFQPLGKRLLRARREGRLVRCLPVPDGDAFFIQFAE